MDHQLTSLDNGVRVITQTMPSVRSASIGCWVNTGSRDEEPVEAGCSHFLEHLLFKGSDRLSAKDIAEAFDRVGARSNAFTSKEATCYWAQMRDQDLPMGVELLAEMIQRPAFRPDEVESESHVVLEEINMNEDDPSDLAHERFATALWADHALALPVLGTRDSILGMSPDTIRAYWQRRYHGPSLVVAVVGHVEHDEVVGLVQEQFTDIGEDSPSRSLNEPHVHSAVEVITKDTEQAHLVLGGGALPHGDDRRFAFGLLNHVMGSGMSSRLFREIREERGLAYAVYSFRMPYLDSGAFGVYVGTTPTQTGSVLDLIRGELSKVADEGIRAEELERSKGHMLGSLALSMEDTNGRMIRLGRQELAGTEHLSLDETVARIEAVTLDEVRDVAKAVYAGPLVLGAVGPFEAGSLDAYVA